MKKRILALVLALTMSVSFCIPVWASSVVEDTSLSLEPYADNSSILSSAVLTADFNNVLNKEDITSDQYQIYTSDMAAFRRLSYNPELLSIVAIDEFGKITYQYNIAGAPETFLQIEYTTENITLDVYENTRHNTIKYLDNGIKIDEDFYPYQVTAEKSRTARARATEYLSSPPAGYTSGSYSYSHTVQIDRFDIPRKLATYTTSALCALLALELFPEVASSTAGAVLYSLISAEIGNLIQSAISNPTANNNTYLSYKIKYLEHEDSYSLDRVYKCYAYFYPTTNCTGSTGSASVYYYHNYFF